MIMALPMTKRYRLPFMGSLVFTCVHFQPLGKTVYYMIPYLWTLKLVKKN
jgi:hypothetical protein